MADTPDLGSGAERLGGSTPPFRTFSRVFLLAMACNQLLFCGLFLGLALPGILTGCASVPRTAQHRDNFDFRQTAGSCVPAASLPRIFEEEQISTAAALRPLERTKWDLVAEFKNREPVATEPPAVFSKGFRFHARIEPGARLPVIYRQKNAPGAPEELMIDFNLILAEASSPSLQTLRISDDGSAVAFTARLQDDAAPQLFLRLADEAAWLVRTDPVSEMEWAQGGRSVYFTTLCGQRPCRLFRLPLDQSSSGPELLLEETREDRYLSLARTRDLSQLVLSSETASTGDIFTLDLASSGARLRLLPGAPDKGRPRVEKRAENWILLSSQRQAVFSRPLACLTGCTWEEKYRPPADAFVKDMLVFRDMTVLQISRQGNDSILVLDSQFVPIKLTSFTAPAYSLELSRLGDFESRSFRFTYSSLNEPREIREYSLDTQMISTLSRDIPQRFSSSDYALERLQAPSSDGTSIPLTLVYRKDLLKQGRNPLWITAYGAYGHSLPAAFSARRLSLLDRGFVYAIAHVRGGGELGQKWHEQGKGLNKLNSIEDFLASIRHLESLGYCAPGNVTAWGSSAGGLIAAAAMTRSPASFRSVILDAPFLDVTGAMLDPQLPHTLREYEEWGNPAEPGVLPYLRSYSPYDILKEQQYPPILLLHNLPDQIIPADRSFCWARHLRRLKTDSNPLILRFNQNGTHARPADSAAELEEEALRYAFALAYAE